MSEPPLKPWERTNPPSLVQDDLPAVTSVPIVPDRPITSNSYSFSPETQRYPNTRYSNSYGNSYGSGYGNYVGYGNSFGGYGSYGGYNSYSSPSPYNRFNSGPMHPGMPNQLPESTQHAFQVIDQVVQAFGGFAQMLESAFFATQSSFHAMVGLAEHLGNLKGFLGQVFSVFAVFAGIKRFFSGKNRTNSLADEFTSKSRAPWLIFLLSLTSPLIIMLLVRRFSKPKLKKPVKIEFCRAKYDFNGSNPTELSLKRGDLVAVTEKIMNPDGTSSWWHGRLQDGSFGIFPANYVELIESNALYLK